MITRTTFQIAIVAGVTILVTWSLPGCGGSNNKPANEQTSSESAGNSSSDSNAPSVASSSGNGSSGESHRQDEVWTDENGNKYLGSVPYDAFFDQPYSVAGNNTSLAGGTSVADTGAVAPINSGMAAGGTGTATETVSTAAEPETTADAGGESWGDRISGDVLNNEVTSVRNFLNATLQSVGSYNSSMLMIEPKVAALATLAHISPNHPGDISWKKEAPIIRELAKRMNESPLQRGAKDQGRLKKLFESMVDTFNHSPPADLEEPSAEDGFSDVAEMSSIMKRMEEAEKRMKIEAGSESSFESNKDMVKHEAAILRTFTHVIALEEFGYGDDEEFTGYAQQIMDATREIENATESGDFSSYDLALSKISTNCQACHSVFKNN